MNVSMLKLITKIVGIYYIYKILKIIFHYLVYVAPCSLMNLLSSDSCHKGNMIEVTAKLVRGSVYLSGETIECCITFCNKPPSGHKQFQSNKDGFESLAWASAQIHCFCSTDQKVRKTSEDETKNPISNSETALNEDLQETGRTEIATKPKILFCDLRLAPGEKRICKYTNFKCFISNFG